MPLCQGPTGSPRRSRSAWDSTKTDIAVTSPLGTTSSLKSLPRAVLQGLDQISVSLLIGFQSNQKDTIQKGSVGINLGSQNRKIRAGYRAMNDGMGKSDCDNPFMRTIKYLLRGYF